MNPSPLIPAVLVFSLAVSLSQGAQVVIPKRLLVTDIGTDRVFTADLDGSNAQTQFSTNANPIDAKQVGNKIYYTENLTAAVRVADPDGANAMDIWSGSKAISTAENIALDLNGGRIYWTDDIADVIRSSNLDGTDVLDVLDVGPANPFDIALDVLDGKMYWTETSGINIRRANLDGSDPETLVTTGGPVGTYLGLALDLANGKMYWTHRQDSSVQRANLDGTSLETIATGRDTPRGIAVDPEGGFIYWAEAGGSDSIIRAGLDGSDPTAIITGLSNPWSVDVIPEPSQTFFILLASLALLARRR